MTRRNVFIILTAVLVLGVASGYLVLRTRNRPSKLTPITNHGKKWRIGYIEGGGYSDYSVHLKAMISGLMELGWIGKGELPEGESPEDTKGIWDYLSMEMRSDYIEFVPDAYWSCDWDPERREVMKAEVVERLNGRKDIDLMLAMGTWSGVDLANDSHSVPVVVISASDPVQAGIVDSIEDSGHDHVHATCYPDRYLMQARTFHRIVNFERLGVVYEDTPEGMVWANVHDLRKVAKERGFILVERHVRDTGVTMEEAAKELSAVYEEMAPKIDALWISTLQGETAKFMPGILLPMFEHKVPTWAQLGPRQVRRGVLFSISDRDYADVGMFNAKVIARILNGEKPRDIPQSYEPEKSLAINLATARAIGFKVPPSLLEVADVVYDEVEGWRDTEPDWE